jgi:hypothetical protein
MKYEPCAGQCYAYSDVMRIHTLGLDVQGAVRFLQRLVAIHGPSCGNENLQFRLDVEERIPLFKVPVFIASFYHYGALDLFYGPTPLEALDKMIDAALAYYSSEQYEEDVVEHGGGDHDACEHGDDKKLVEFAITFSGLGQDDQNALRKMFTT